MSPPDGALLTVIGDTMLTQDEARSAIPRRLRRRHHRVGSAPGRLLLHPMWMAWATVTADRPPFPPRVRATMIFVDGVSGYRGQLTSVPHTEQVQIGSATVHEATVTEEHALELVRDVQSSQIDRSYVVRKPRHEIHRLELLHLRLWMFEHDDERAVVNAVTGADESYLAGRWP